MKVCMNLQHQKLKMYVEVEKRPRAGQTTLILKYVFCIFVSSFMLLIRVRRIRLSFISATFPCSQQYLASLHKCMAVMYNGQLTLIKS